MLDEKNPVDENNQSDLITISVFLNNRFDKFCFCYKRDNDESVEGIPAQILPEAFAEETEDDANNGDSNNKYSSMSLGQLEEEYANLMATLENLRLEVNLLHEDLATAPPTLNPIGHSFKALQLSKNSQLQSELLAAIAKGN
ncbi:MAG: hypothetical protein SGARI_000542 [Bacillariaceae sp.]